MRLVDPLQTPAATTGAPARGPGVGLRPAEVQRGPQGAPPPHGRYPYCMTMCVGGQNVLKEVILLFAILWGRRRVVRFDLNSLASAKVTFHYQRPRWSSEQPTVQTDRDHRLQIDSNINTDRQPYLERADKGGKVVKEGERRE
ncbi:hypothetical protein EVAR_92935_1 [Eumeta japonica]|uniref:Uncharacterized protein n=1 Tax=Eumeta variegata TaxID=151549 RepID=A0A4C1TCX2_EUMVA|nr:hypothetical protein EVAR_92935_1 [Eumeta japonica]